MAGKKGRSGGRRAGAGRPIGSGPITRAVAVERERHRAANGVDLLPSVFMRRVMNDETTPLAARIMCAGKVTPFVELERLPVLREMADANAEDWCRRQLADIEAHPEFYDWFLERMPAPPVRKNR